MSRLITALAACELKPKPARSARVCAHGLDALGFALAALLAACASSSTPTTPGGATGAKIPAAPQTGSTAATPPATPPPLTPSVQTPPAAGAAGTSSVTPPVAVTPAPATNNPQTGGAGAPATPTPVTGEPEQLMGECPDGFMPKAGANTNFPSDGLMRQFVVTAPTDVTTPRPLLMILTGTVESTTDSMESHSRLTADLLPKGWLLVGPVRQCSTGPTDASSSCNSAGSGGWNWKPWNEGAASGSAGMKWWSDEGPDARFFKSMVKCVATKFPVDAKRMFVIGISSGATMTNRLLTFQSDFWAGGVPESGEWYLNPNNQAVMQDPTKIYTGRCCPLPDLPKKLGPMFIITSWGGPTDMWMGLADYAPTSQAASNYYTSQDDVINISCGAKHGHMWQPVAGMNVWMADQLAAHPKGSTIAPNNTPSYKLPSDPPMPYTCEVGRFTKIYGK